METGRKNNRDLGIDTPSQGVVRFAALAPPDGAVLDLACGGGRHGRYFLERGHAVTFVDRDVSGLRDLASREGVEIAEADLESPPGWPLGNRRFACIVVTNYLWRPLLPMLAGAVETGGVLIYETFAVGNEAYSRPRSPDHLLRSGELLEAFGGALQVVAYEHGVRRDPKPRVVQRIAAVNSHQPPAISPQQEADG